MLKIKNNKLSESINLENFPENYREIPKCIDESILGSGEKYGPGCRRQEGSKKIR